MRARKDPTSGQAELFRTRLENLIDDRHELVQLAAKLDWEMFDEKFGTMFSEGSGRPALPTRLMVGLQYLKYLYNESDENLVRRFIENPYWQHFCGNEYFEHHLPCHPTSLVKWRKRLGHAGAEKMLRETINLAKREGAITDTELAEVNIDTTVQEKAISYPTDGALVDTARRMLIRAAGRAGIELKQSYKFIGRKALIKHCRLKHCKDMKGSRKYLRKLRTYLGRVIRDIERKAHSPSHALNYALGIAKKIFEQRPKTKNKIYSVHAPEVQCIAKGKVHKKYEFGNKVSVATTAKGSWIVGLYSFLGNPFDGHTVPDVLCQINSVTGGYPKAAYCDRGYRGSEGHIFATHVYLQGTKRTKDARIKRRLKGRSAIEAVIGHLKNDHRMDRNFLHGFTGDKINALMAACAFNLRKLVRVLFCLFLSVQRVSWQLSWKI
ncbi:MAG: IS5 family transposase [Gammaproteobacteria bacterium]